MKMTKNEDGKTLTLEDFTLLEKGCPALGSGGGGAAEHGYLACVASHKRKKSAKMVSLDQCADDDYVIFMGMLGAPSILLEKGPSTEEWWLAFSKMQIETPKKIRYIAPMEIGGANGLLAIAMAMEIGSDHVSILDVDAMGRANPKCTDTLPYLNKTYDQFTCVLTAGESVRTIRAKNADDLEDQARKITLEMGGNTTVAFLPMPIKELKKTNSEGCHVNCVPGSISTALEIGRALSTVKNRDAMVKALNTTLTEKQLGYCEAQWAITGKITNVVSECTVGFDIGYFDVQGCEHDHSKKLRVFFKNENLSVQDLHSGKHICDVPNIVSIFNSELDVVSCGQYQIGMEVNVLTIQVPLSMRSENAIKILSSELKDLLDAIRALPEQPENSRPNTQTPQSASLEPTSSPAAIVKNASAASFFSHAKSPESHEIWMDVGGTNTHSVLAAIYADATATVLNTNDTPTTLDIHSGILNGTNSLFCDKTTHLKSKINSITIGTTHFVNNVLEARGINQVLVLQLGAPAITAIPALTGWPSELAELIGEHVYTCKGGFEYDGKPISELDVNEIQNYIDAAYKGGVRHAAVIGVFSMLKPEQELEIARYCTVKGMHVTCSHQVGDLDRLARANATILNAGLQIKFNEFLRSVQTGLLQARLSHCNIYYCLNDGTCTTMDKLMPIRTYGSGTTNSVLGGKFLTTLVENTELATAPVIDLRSPNNLLKNLLIVDIGGSSTDVGGTKHGAPINTFSAKIGEIKCNMRGALKYSIAWGGGSAIEVDELGNVTSFAKHSVAYNLTQDAVCCGGNVLTPTCIAVAKNRIQFGDIENVNQWLEQNQHVNIDNIEDHINRILAKVINKFLIQFIDVENINIMIVGGGAHIIDPKKILELLDIKKVELCATPKLSQSTNALGAGGGLISGTALRIFTLDDDAQKPEFTKQIRDLARQQACENGADSEGTFREDFLSTHKLMYLDGKRLRLACTMVGDLRPKSPSPGLVETIDTFNANPK